MKIFLILLGFIIIFVGLSMPEKVIVEKKYKFKYYKNNKLVGVYYRDLDESEKWVVGKPDYDTVDVEAL